MHRISRTLRHAVQLVCVCALLVAPRAEASGRAVLADFDGDGHGDRASLDARDPSIVRIWFSATRTTQIIRSAQPLRDISAVDLNGDRYPELVASNRSPGLQVWVKAHKGFRHYRRNGPFSSRDIAPPNRRRVDDDADRFAPAIGAAKPPPPSIAGNLHRRRPPSGVRTAAASLTRAARSASRVAAFAPRPPPGLAL
jgi:hypothetical protein